MSESSALLTDHYELTMVSAALRDGTADRQCVFEVFARRLPSGRRYGVVAGTGRLVDALRDFRFAPEEVEFLVSRGVVDQATGVWLAGYRFGGQFDVPDTTQNADVRNDASYGVSVGLHVLGASTYDELDRYELFYSRQPTHLGHDSPVGAADVSIQYLHFGGSKEFSTSRRARPYLLGAFGLTRMSLDAPGARDDTRFSLSMAGGVRMPVREHFSIRVEGRGYLTFLSADSSVFCASGSAGGACGIHASGSSLFQFEVMAGATFDF